jgi:hypothetical protein
MTDVEKALLRGGSVAQFERLAVRLPEATYITGFSRSELYRRAARGEVIFLKSGNTTLVDVPSLQAAVASLPRAVIKGAEMQRPRTPGAGSTGAQSLLASDGAVAQAGPSTLQENALPLPLVSAPRYRDPASLRPQPARDGHDFWATPRCLIDALTKTVLAELPTAAIWECAAGDGSLVRALRAAGHTVVASDIEPRAAGIERRDFLSEEPPPGHFIVATNPPFCAIDQFLARGLHLLDNGLIVGLVLLVRCDTLTAATRADAFNRATGILTCCWRPVWIEGSKGNGRWSNAWVWWLPDYPGPPAARWLRPVRGQQGSPAIFRTASDRGRV